MRLAAEEPQPIYIEEIAVGLSQRANPMLLGWFERPRSAENKISLVI